MRFVIVTGMSGAGKSTALKMLEDVGYFCVDNLPVPLIPKMADLLRVPGTEINKAALGVDIRSGQSFRELEKVLDELDMTGLKYEILFLESSDNVLVKRYKETRRFHPLSGNDSRVDQGIQREREQLKFLKKRADYLVDTSHMLTRELKAELNKIFVQNKEYKNLYISVLSFGFKYGIPNDADLVFDVRFLPNPYYIEELRSKSGNDREVRDYVMNNDKAKKFLEKLLDMVEFLIPNYIAEGKTQLVIGIGCTGGKHRSVTLANELFEQLKDTEVYGIRIEHRDIGKDAVTKAR
ncbi:RNase adapter RapZ [[Clostridium] hylemonae]|uniref:RNase adapter RapZ n=1 Tax=[Clostridium] hylemonae TaxID=89153 RepID=UPI00110612EF|nr:RNase adapter RapZ [[Clostridium] hylemonae]